MKIPFTLDAWLKDKSQKVETRSGKNVRIICWDKTGVPIVALVGDADDIVTYNRDGTIGQQLQLPSDLFIITPEPELTEFEEKVKQLIGSYPCANKENKGSLLYEVRKAAAELFALAKKELCERGETKDRYAEGKAEALKDLPK